MSKFPCGSDSKKSSQKKKTTYVRTYVRTDGRTDGQKKSIFAQTPYREKEGKGGPTPLTLNRVGIRRII